MLLLRSTKYYGGKGYIGLNDGRRRERKEKAVPRDAAGFAQQLITCKNITFSMLKAHKIPIFWF